MTQANEPVLNDRGSQVQENDPNYAKYAQAGQPDTSDVGMNDGTTSGGTTSGSGSSSGGSDSGGSGSSSGS